MLGKEGLIGGAVSGSVALLLYIWSTNEHNADRQLQQVKQEQAVAEFDRDFASAAGDKAAAVVYAAKAAEAAKAVADAKAVATVKHAEADIQREELAKGARDVKQSTDGKVDLQSALNKLR